MKYDRIIINDIGKASVCPICNNEDTDIKGDYCQICGAFLRNKCTNLDCDIELSGDSRYCSICGAESTFHKGGLLKDWTDSKDKFTTSTPLIDNIDLDKKTADESFIPNYYLTKDN
ncbi:MULTISPECIES: hypothetical protein [Clostridium]|uniref:Double zinc ribbon n=1 Tax=Clostridium cibarium TaxID=2762247 RepID=A0ABR8PVX7_9CLOT|nr:MULTISPECIES: hypothetical protein [Clostridium]MBD7912335.1 hypothetical protein [Clostridium cibarium]